MASPYAVTYLLTLGNVAQAAALRAANPSGLLIPPGTAAALYGAHFLDGSYATPRITFQGPSAFYADPAHYYDETWTQTIPFYSGTFDFYWVGEIVSEGATSGQPVPTQAISTRYWIDGFEIPTFGEGGSGPFSTNSSRDASRTDEGYGGAYRSSYNSQRVFTTAAGQTSVWERLYLRLRVLPVGGIESFWGMLGSGQAGEAWHAAVTTAGVLNVYNMGNQAYPGTLMGSTAALPLNTWVRLDVLYTIKNGAGVAASELGRFALYLNGVQIFEATPGSSGGLNLVQTISENRLGGITHTAGATFNLEADFDDWIGATLPAFAQVFPRITPNALDWLNGSHVQLIRATAFAPDHSASWVGNFRTLLTNPVANEDAGNVLTTSTPSVRMSVTTDYVDRQVGCAAFRVAIIASTASGTGNLGWAFNGVETLTPVAMSAVWKGVLTTNAGTTPPALAPLKLIYEKAADVTLQTIQALQGVAEYLGSWGPEDTASTVFPARIGVHNAPYPNLDALVAPLGTVATHSGIYTGNNLGQDVLTKVPAHFWWVRPLTGGLTGVVWYSGMVGAQARLAQGAAADRMVMALLDGATPTTQGAPTMRVAGTNVDSNNTGRSYQWVAFSDPAMRYLLCGMLSHNTALTGPIANALVDPIFTPKGLFIFKQRQNGSTSNHFYKGPGHPTDRASLLDAADQASVLTLGAGVITTQLAVHAQDPGAAFAAFRTDDGSGAVGALDILTYTGDGTGARVIPLALNGQTPIFAVVVPHNGQSFFRDPSHTGSNSIRIDGTNSTTAITAFGADSLTVGATLNTNAIVYDVFVLPGLPNSTDPTVVVPPIQRPSCAPFACPPGAPVPPPSGGSGCPDSFPVT